MTKIFPIDEIIYEYLNTPISKNKLAKKYECDKGTIKKIFDKNGIKTKPPNIGKNNDKFNGFEELPGSYWYNIQVGAKNRSIEFNISIEYAWNIFLQQNRNCKLSSQKIEFAKSFKTKHTASLDRIDPSKGYIEGNVQWIHKNVNRAKNNYTQAEFIALCTAVALHNP